MIVRHVLALMLAAVALPAMAQTDLSAPNEPVGHHFLVLLENLPPPWATESAGERAELHPLPDPPALNLPEGFEVNLFAEGFEHCRWLAVAPNGDVFLAETRPDLVRVLRDGDGDGVAETDSVFWDDFDGPTGMAFQDGALYVADLEGVWRFDYRQGDLEARADPVMVTAPGALGPTEGHWTRTLAFAPDGTRFFVGIGSRGNVDVEAEPRATVQVFDADGGGQATFASGLRNPVGIAHHPETGELYTVVNERDGYGDDLVPDFFTRLRQGDFYGWPWAYAGTHPDPEFGAEAPDRVAASLLPDVLFQSHSAPLGLVFYDGASFPEDYRGDAFVALHGSWNRAIPTGYKIVRIRFEDGRPAGGYENFATGFWFAGETKAQIFGRPAGLAIAGDGSLLVADDAAQVVWRIAWTGD